jgi:hypothetical protein
MAFEAIWDEVGQLNLAGNRSEGLGEHHPPVSEALISIAGDVAHRDGIGKAGGDKAAERRWSQFHCFKEAYLKSLAHLGAHRSETC